jgi:hypothetical protein
MMDEMLVQELIKLERGVIFTVAEHDGVAKKHVYLQARLLYAHLDTKALEKMGLLKLCNSLYGCMLCNLQSGAYRHTLHKCVYKNTRLPLQASCVATCWPAAVCSGGIQQKTNRDSHDRGTTTWATSLTGESSRRNVKPQ